MVTEEKKCGVKVYESKVDVKGVRVTEPLQVR